MRRRQHSRKLNNVGMSLVEVVIAIAIMSIVILPVLRTFVQSARYNATARMRQQTTAAAQTVMENFKAYSVQEICDQFDSNSFNVSASPANFSTLCVPDSPSVGDYLFEITGMRYQDVDYDVRVELTSHKNSSGIDEANMGSMDSLIYTFPTSENDAIYCCDPDMDLKALEGILQEVADKWNEKENSSLATPAPEASPVPTSTPTHSSSELDASKVTITERTITFTVSKPDDKYVIRVSCQYKYTTRNINYTDPITGDPVPLNESGVYILDLSGDLDDGKDYDELSNQYIELKSLTVCYYPAYNQGNVVKISEDIININNTCPELGELKCCVYKQRHDLSDHEITMAESSYGVCIELTNAEIYDDNLGIKLKDYTWSEAMNGNVAVKTNVGGSFIPTNEKRYKGIGYRGTLSGDEKTALSGITLESQRLIYDITITIYNSGEMNIPGAQPLNSLKGTIVR